MGLFNWFRKTKVGLTESEQKELQQDRDLLAIAAALNASNNSTGSPFASMPGVRKVPPLIYACMVGKLSMVKDAINRGSDPNESDEDEITPLHAAAGDGNLEIVRFLLEQGADRGLRDHAGMLAVDLAGDKGHEAVVELLGGKG